MNNVCKTSTLTLQEQFHHSNLAHSHYKNEITHSHYKNEIRSSKTKIKHNMN